LDEITIDDIPALTLGAGVLATARLHAAHECSPPTPS